MKNINLFLDLNRTESDYQRDVSLQTIVERWVDRRPHKIAAKFQGKVITYIELEKKANQIAHILLQRGVSKGAFVGIFLERGLDLLIAQVGVLKAGAAFVCFDPAYPRDALTRILAQVPLSTVISNENLKADFPIKSVTIYSVDDKNLLANVSDKRITNSTHSSDPAFLLFTSGSTGQPKAILHTHRNIVARFSNTKSKTQFNEHSVFAQVSPVSSIDAIDETLLPLFCGGQTAITPYDVVVDIPKLVESMANDDVTHILLVPSLLRVILASQAKIEVHLRKIKTWMVGGEALAGILAAQFYERLPDAQLINYYGLTEGDVSLHIVEPRKKYSGYVPIGRPIQNTKIYLFDENSELVSAGEPGEICVAGEGLFQEYFGNPELDSERWVQNPFVEESEKRYSRLFKTGDVARIGAEGEIEYIGRKDRMVKIRGFRVELGEVEEALLKHPDVSACVVTAHRSGKGDATHEEANLVAYIVLKSSSQITSAKLLLYASEYLPNFAVPAVVMLMDELPLSPNGKVDIRKLPEPVFVLLPNRDQDIDAPRNPVELELIKMWEKLLHHASIGIYDNFFEIGGDSLAAIDLTLQIEKKFNISLPIAALLEAPTVEKLAEMLKGNKTYTWSSLVPIRAGGERLPLFCIHADGGVLFYYQFAQYMDRSIPIYGLQARGLLGHDDEPLDRIEDMASHYINEIRTVQPTGPYLLCGYSTGGFIIFEMAQQLKNMGEEVALVCMLDAYGPNYPKILPQKNLFLYKLSVHLNTLRTYGIVNQVKYIWERSWKRMAYILSHLIGWIFPLLHLPLPHRVRYNQIARLINRAENQYKPKTYIGDIVLLRASVQPENIYPDAHLGWGEFVKGNIKVYEIDGTHNSIMRMPYLSKLISALQMQLDEIEKERKPVEDKCTVSQCFLIILAHLLHWVEKIPVG